MNGADLVCSVLRRLDVQCVFGLPGTQNVRLYEAMRAAGLRRVVSADEGSAAFMAAGYARASGRVGVLTTIPGPGFVYALPGIVEARHDSVPLLWITLRQADLGRAFQLQRIDQAQMAAPAVKRCFHIGSGDALVTTLAAAHELARAGEPGPVLVEIDAALLDTNGADSTLAPSRPAMPKTEALAARLAESRHPVLYVGQGAQDGSEAVRALARRLSAPVLCTSSGRGVLPDTGASSIAMPSADDVTCSAWVRNRVGSSRVEPGRTGYCSPSSRDRRVAALTASSTAARIAPTSNARSPAAARGHRSSSTGRSGSCRRPTMPQ
jgi:acetolactate synthase-1/2/3 large subunit